VDHLPDVHRLPLPVNEDLIVVCGSDGLWNVISMPVLCTQVAIYHDNLRQLCHSLLELASMAWDAQKSGDNITVAVARFHQP